MSAAWLDSLRHVPEIGPSPFALLGSLVSCPPLAPYGLIRQARRTVFGRGTLYLEAMLCDSDLVETVSKDGVELAHEFRTAAQLALRERVLSGEIPISELRAATRCEHLGMSPLLLLEEQLVWAFISEPDPAPECDRLLSDCLLSIVREDRHHILDWAAGALRRLPDAVVATQAAWLLSELCNALHRETRKVAPPQVDQIEPGLLREVLPLLPSVLVGFYRDGDSLTLGPINRRRRIAFAVPGIALRPVTVTWTDPERRELTVDVTGHVDLIPVGRSAVRLRNAAGAVVSLSSFTPGAIAPELIELDKSLDLLEDAWRNARSVTAIVVRAVSSVGAIVRFLEAPTISSYLRLERSYLDEMGINPWNLVGRQIDVRISSFERPHQRIVCRPAESGSWSAGLLVPGMEVEARFNNAVHYGFFVEVPITDRGFEGPTIGGLIHESELPLWWLNRSSDLRKGDRLLVRILEIDQEKRRINLGITDDITDVLSQLPEGKVLTGQISKVVPFGVLVELPPGFYALLHNTEIAEGRQFVLGEAIRVRILHVDYERNRISLGTEPRIPAGTPSRPLTPIPKQKGARREIAPVAGKDIRATQADHPAPEAVAEFLRQLLRRLHGPIDFASLASIVRAEFGAAVADGWMGHEKFKPMLVALVPEATLEQGGPGRVYPLGGSAR